MKQKLIILGILSLFFQTGIFAQITATVESEKTYPNDTRICYFKTDKTFSEQAKEIIKAEAEKHEKIIRLSFFDGNAAMFKSSVDFTLDSLVNVINSINLSGIEAFEQRSSVSPRSVPQSICDVIQPACADNQMDITFPAVVNHDNVYGSVGCLSTTPNPTWYYIQIDNPGNMNIYMESDVIGTYDGDIDFIAWGPFNSLDDACAQINLVDCPSCPNNTDYWEPDFYPHGNITDCSYDPANYETLHIQNATHGDIYVLLITNYEDEPFDINFHKVSGNATTDCSILTPPISNNGPLCVGDTLKLTAQTSNVTGAVYTWTGPNGFTSTEQNPVIPNVTVANAGTYTLVVSDGTDTGDPQTMEVVIVDCNIVTFAPIEEICADYDKMTISFGIENGELVGYSATFDTKSNAAGFVNIPMHAQSGNIIEFPLPANVRPDYSYSVTLTCDFAIGVDKVFVLNFDVLYPSSIITQRWNDVLSLTNENYNGGYIFSAYEWYKNDVQIPNANGSYYYTGTDNDEELDFDAVYRARPTRADDGVKIFTCGITPVQVNAFLTTRPQLVQVDQQIIVSHIIEKTSVSVYNIMGIRVGEYQLSEYANSFQAPTIAGSYAVVFEMQDGGRWIERIIIQ